MKYFAIIVAVCFCLSCNKYSTSIPDCIAAKIEFLKSQPKGHPTYSVYQYTYNGQKVYYFPPQCCDQYSELYDENCNLICYPDGGLVANSGNQNCRDFFTARKNEVLIWKDNR